MAGVFDGGKVAEGIDIGNQADRVINFFFEKVLETVH